MALQTMTVSRRAALLRPFMVVFFIAAAVRLAFVAHFSALVPTTVSAEMLNIAQNIAEGRGFSSPFGPGATPTAWECPIVPYLFAGAFRIARNPRTAIVLMVLAQAVVSAFAAAMYWLIARRLLDRYPEKFRPWLPWVIAVFAILWLETLFVVLDPWYYVWQEAGLALFVLAAMHWWERPVTPRCLLLGLTGGVLALINVTPLLVIAFAIFYPAFKSRGQARIFKQTLICFATFAIVISPQLVRNAVVFRSFVPLRSNSGFEFFQGNNEVECIREPVNSPHPARDAMEFKRYVELGEIRYCREAFGRGSAYIRQHPGQTVARIFERIYVTWLTDLTDRWTPTPEHKWWTLSWRFIAGYLASVFVLSVSIGVVLWGVLSGRFRSLPYAHLFGAILLLLPIPHYFTLADAEYSVTFREWMVIAAIFLLALRPSAVAGPSKQ
jgi:hypothetical protein